MHHHPPTININILY
ncbi:rCG59841, partial [Rattus norvegicus]